MDGITRASFQAVSRGFQPVPLLPRDKKPSVGAWTHIRWDPNTTEAEVAARFAEWGYDGAPGSPACNVGILLGEPSGNLLDVDLDHPRTARLKDFFLPPTPARGGRAGKPNSHYWYIAEEGTLPGTRVHTMPREFDDESGKWRKGPVIVELRSTGAQTVIPPSIHPSGQAYTWSSEPWGGKAGPMVVNGRRLAVQVALLALGTVLLDAWPTKGSRHEAYLSLAGGLLREGDASVHPYWEQNASVLIRALAEATQDDDGPDAREAESISSTIRNLRNGNPVSGFGKLAEILGDEVVKQVRILVGEVEAAAGVQSRQAATATVDIQAEINHRDTEIGSIEPEDRDPLEERLGTWEPLDLDPYLSGRVRPVDPTVMLREDGQALMYPGRVNMLYGSSESAKSWIALHTCIQVMSQGERVMYLDFEDEPVNTLDRLKRMGAGADDLRFLFSYVRPEEPIAPMQRNRWGQDNITKEGERNWELFSRAVEHADPSLIVADGMTVLYGLHGLDSNDAVSTDIITGWLKRLTRNGRSTVIIIDHTSKGSEKGSTPIGSQHKQAMVQGTMIQVWPIRQPMPGAIGEVELVVLKDRPGQVRASSVKSGLKAQTAARVVIDSTVADITEIKILPPPDPNNPTQANPSDQAKIDAEIKKKQKERADKEQLLKLWGGVVDKELSMAEIMQGLGYKREGATDSHIGSWPVDEEKHWRGMIGRLITEGWLYGIGETKSRRYALAISDTGDGVDVDLSNAGTDD